MDKKQIERLVGVVVTVILAALAAAGWYFPIDVPAPAEIDAQGVRYGQYGNAAFHGDTIVDGDMSVDGTTNIDDLDVDASGEIEIDGGLTDFGGCTAGVADGDNDVCIAAVLEVDGELEADGAIDADSTLDVDGTSNLDEVDIDGVTNIVVGTEHIGTMTIASTAITYTAGAGGSGTVATIGAGEIWLVHDVLVNVTTNFDATGDDEHLIIGDGNDTDGFLVLDDTDLKTDYAEGVTGHATGWLGKIEANVGVYFDPDGTDGFHNNTFVYDGADTIDWALTVDDGDDLSAGAATIYVIYTRIQ